MFFQRVFTRKALTTLIALVRLLYLMGPLVSDQINFLYKASIALLAHKWLFIRVGILVPYQMVFLEIAFMTVLAFILFLIRVNALVSCQRAFADKALTTLLAFIRLLPRVDQQMRFQVAIFPNYFCTQRTWIFFSTLVSVGIRGRWQAIDFSLAYIGFAVLAMLDKRSEL